jgi:hypothetical protein
MRRVWAILASASLIAVWGCGSSYDIRMNKTLDDMRYRKRLDDNLMPAQTKGKFEELMIFVRPPKNLQPAKEFLLPLPEPGKFDLEASFLETQKAGDAPQAPGAPTEAGTEPKPPTDTQKQSLHILARVKRPKNPNAKKKAEPVNRGDFNRDVLALINAAYAPPAELTIDKFKETKKKNNSFKQHAFAVNGKNVQVYLYGQKNSAYEVALIFEYPSTEHANLYSKIELCLESFAEGNKARRAFSGAVGDEKTGEGGAAPTPGVF